MYIYIYTYVCEIYVLCSSRMFAKNIYLLTLCGALQRESSVHDLVTQGFSSDKDDEDMPPPASALAHRAQIILSDSDSEEEVWM